VSYCRWSRWNDVYVFGGHMEDGTEQWECCACHRAPMYTTEMLGKKFRNHHSRIFKTRRGILNHLLWHLQLGDKVVRRAIRRLKREIREENSR